MRRIVYLSGPPSSAMPACRNLLGDFIKDESGQDLIEYALIVALIALGCTAAMSTLASKIGTAFAAVGAKLTNSL